MIAQPAANCASRMGVPTLLVRPSHVRPHSAISRVGNLSCERSQDSNVRNHAIEGSTAEITILSSHDHHLFVLIDQRRYSETTSNIHRLNRRQDVKTTHERTRYRHCNACKLIGRILETLRAANHPIQSELFDALMPSSCFHRYSRELPVERGQQHECLIFPFFGEGDGRSSGEIVGLCSESPNCYGRSGRYQHTCRGDETCCYGDRHPYPGNHHAPRVPPNHAVLAQHPALVNAIQHAHSLTPLWIGRHFAMGAQRAAA